VLRPHRPPSSLRHRVQLLVRLLLHVRERLLLRAPLHQPGASATAAIVAEGGRGPPAPSAGAAPGGQGSAPPGTVVYPSFAHPWAGTVRMWTYDQSGRPPPPQPAFYVAPHYGGFAALPGAYGGAYGAPPPSYGTYYGGAAPPGFQAPSPAYQAAPWNPTHGGSWHQDSLAHSFNTMTLNPPASEWYDDSGVGSHMTSDAGILSTISPPSSSTPSSIVVGNGALLPVTAIGSHIFSLLHRNLALNNILVSPNITTTTTTTKPLSPKQVGVG